MFAAFLFSAMKRARKRGPNALVKLSGKAWFLGQTFGQHLNRSVFGWLAKNEFRLQQCAEIAFADVRAVGPSRGCKEIGLPKNGERGCSSVGYFIRLDGKTQSMIWASGAPGTKVTHGVRDLRNLFCHFPSVIA
jgi:hypothetical protein